MRPTKRKFHESSCSCRTEEASCQPSAAPSTSGNQKPLSITDEPLCGKVVEASTPPSKAPSTSSNQQTNSKTGEPPTKRQKIDSNFFNAPKYDGRSGLRPIVIDGSNVAFEYRREIAKQFDAKGIQIVVDYFQARGHKEIYVFVPHFRLPDPRTVNKHILQALANKGILHFTPSRYVRGRLISAYDDRYILDVATVTKGVIVSNDRFRDIEDEKPEWKKTVEENLLMFNFVGELLMFPQDPLGQHGPSLDEFLRFPKGGG